MATAPSRSNLCERFSGFHINILIFVASSILANASHFSRENAHAFGKTLPWLTTQSTRSSSLSYSESDSPFRNCSFLLRSAVTSNFIILCCSSKDAMLSLRSGVMLHVRGQSNSSSVTFFLALSSSLCRLLTKMTPYICSIASVNSSLTSTHFLVSSSAYTSQFVSCMSHGIRD